MAFKVAFAEIEIGAEYNVDDAVGLLPSVV
jgi:hypothetical protein